MRALQEQVETDVQSHQPPVVLSERRRAVLLGRDRRGLGGRRGVRGRIGWPALAARELAVLGLWRAPGVSGGDSLRDRGGVGVRRVPGDGPRPAGPRGWHTVFVLRPASIRAARIWMSGRRAGVQASVAQLAVLRRAGRLLLPCGSVRDRDLRNSRRQDADGDARGQANDGVCRLPFSSSSAHVIAATRLGMSLGSPQYARSSASTTAGIICSSLATILIAVWLEQTGPAARI